jgi:hypothetical protein
MTTGINVDAFRAFAMPIIKENIANLDRLIRTKKGRKQLAAEFRQRAKGLREFAAAGNFSSHCPWPTAEPSLKEADHLDEEALKYERMGSQMGSRGLYGMYLADNAAENYREGHTRIFGKRK